MRIIFTALIKEEAEGGYSVLCPELGVASQGETIEEINYLNRMPMNNC
jgi:predicted RNase H-like HicB family nuclease